jgi:D-sedoheptulose 7-phosphate isomerase
MDLTEHVVDNFHRHIDNTMQAIEALSPATVAAGELLVQALLNEGKVYCCGEGSSGLLSQHFASLLLNRSHRERPGLPAVALNGDAALLTAITTDTSFNEIFAKQIRTLATAQDILVLISHDMGSGTALQTIQSAHDRNIRVIVLCNDDDGDIRALLAPDDCELRIAATQRTHFFEIALLTLHNLCELIELQLFGSEV